MASPAALKGNCASVVSASFRPVLLRDRSRAERLFVLLLVAARSYFETGRCDRLTSAALQILAGSWRYRFHATGGRILVSVLYETRVRTILLISRREELMRGAGGITVGRGYSTGAGFVLIILPGRAAQGAVKA